MVVPRWVQLVLLPLSLLGLWALARAAGSVLLILIVASMMALIIAPLVRVLERRMPRGLAILPVYLAASRSWWGSGSCSPTPSATRSPTSSTTSRSIVRSADRDLANLQTWLDQHGINVHIHQQGQTALDTLQKDVLKRSGDIVSFSRDLLSSW